MDYILDVVTSYAGDKGGIVYRVIEAWLSALRCTLRKGPPGFFLCIPEGWGVS